MFVHGAVGARGSGSHRVGEKWAATPREEEGASPPVARALGGGWAVAVRDPGSENGVVGRLTGNCLERATGQAQIGQFAVTERVQFVVGRAVGREPFDAERQSGAEAVEPAAGVDGGMGAKGVCHWSTL